MNSANIYPGSSPEFRILVKVDGTNIIQVRYVSHVAGYVGKWQEIPVVKEEEEIK